MSSRVEVEQSSRAQVQYSYLETFTHHLMIGGGEYYFAAFLLVLGFSESGVSWLTSVPVGIGALFQFLSLRILSRLKNHKHLVIGVALLQALSFLPLIYAAHLGYARFRWMTLLFSIYWFASFSYGPSWNYWISKVVVQDSNRRFFSNRSRLQQVALFVSLIGVGFLLRANVNFLQRLDLYMLVFSIACLCRMTSVFSLLFHYYEPSWAQNLPSPSIRQCLKNFWRNSERRRFFLSLVPFTFCVNLTAPLVAPYLLKQVQLPYDTYSIVIASLVIGKIISTFIIQTRLRHLDPKRLMLLGALGAAPLPLFWAFSENVFYMCFLQVISGAAWVLFDVGLSLYFYSDLKEEEKIEIFMTFNFLNSFAILAGGYVGSNVLHMLGETKDSYYILFLTGGLIRVLVAMMVRYKNLGSI